jgi:integrase
MPKLTKTFIDKVPPPIEGYKIHWDDSVKGYGLRVSPCSAQHPNGKRVFVAQGRVQGKAVIITIGPFGLFTEDQARRKAQSILQDMREGIDPRAAKKAEAAARVTLREVMEAYVSRPGKLKPSSQMEIRRHVEKVFAAWADKPIVAITEDDVRKRHREMVEGGLRKKRPAPGQANLAMTTLRALINFASRQYRRTDGSPLFLYNPVEVLRDHWAKLGTRTQRYIERQKIGTVWNALNEARANPKDRDALSGLDLTLFLFLTGARRNEGAMLTWDRVHIDENNPENSLWHLPDPKNGHEVFLPLSTQTAEVLVRRDRVTGNPYVFVSRSRAGHILDPRAPMELVSEIVGKRLSAHDLRRTFTNISMRECLIEKFRTDMLTCHVPAQADVTARNYLDLTKLDWLYPEVQRIGDWIEEQGRIASGANVFSLPQRA